LSATTKTTIPVPLAAAGKRRRRPSAPGSAVSRLVVAPCGLQCSDSIATAHDFETVRAAAAEFFASELRARRVRLCKHAAVTKRRGRLTAVADVAAEPTKEELATIAESVIVVATGGNSSRAQAVALNAGHGGASSLLLGSAVLPGVYLLIASVPPQAASLESSLAPSVAETSSPAVQVLAIRRSRAVAPATVRRPGSVRSGLREVFAFVGPKAAEEAVAAVSTPADELSDDSAGVIILHHLAAPVSWALV
jgi:hypothetical protein